MPNKHHMQKLGELLLSLGPNKEVMMDGRRFNSKHLYNLLEKWHASDAYLVGSDAQHPGGKSIKFDAGDGVYAYIQIAGLVMRG